MLNEDELALQAKALQWLRENMKQLKRDYCDAETFPSENTPVTIFMAGTPGAGKTEFSKSLIDSFPKPIIRIDADEIRERMRSIGYNGENAHCFQRAASNAVNNLYGHALSKSQSALLDGTFAYGNWRENIERSLQQNRIVEIYYLYQDPIIAWGYVEKRRKSQGRAVPKKVFIDDYYSSMANVQKAKEVFEDKVTLYFAKNNYQKDLEYIKIDVRSIDKLLPEVYNITDLERAINDVEEAI